MYLIVFFFYKFYSAFGTYLRSWLHSRLFSTHCLLSARFMNTTRSEITCSRSGTLFGAQRFRHYTNNHIAHTYAGTYGHECVAENVDICSPIRNTCPSRRAFNALYKCKRYSETSISNELYACIAWRREGTGSGGEWENHYIQAVRALSLFYQNIRWNTNRTESVLRAIKPVEFVCFIRHQRENLYRLPNSICSYIDILLLWKQQRIIQLIFLSSIT